MGKCPQSISCCFCWCYIKRLLIFVKLIFFILPLWCNWWPFKEFFWWNSWDLSFIMSYHVVNEEILTSFSVCIHLISFSYCTSYCFEHYIEKELRAKEMSQQLRELVALPGRPEFNFQHTHGISQQSINPLKEILYPLLIFEGTAHMW